MVRSRRDGCGGRCRASGDGAEVAHSFVMVVWPAKPTATAATPKALAALAAAMVRTLAEAQRDSPRSRRADDCELLE